MIFAMNLSPLPTGLLDPPNEFSLLPFWFWNDRLDADEIRRQIDDFQRHGVHGFVIHPRMGLPREIGFLSGTMLDFMAVAVEEAVKRDMKVVLYDEGMYPSGSACGQVVEADPAFQCRCLDRVASSALPAGANVIARYSDVCIIDRPADAVIRGIRYEDEAETREHEPPAGDILNPDAVATFIRLVHERLATAFEEHFGKTIVGIFTDEPNPLGRCREKDVWPGTQGIVEHVSRLLGEDFTPHLPALFDDSVPDAARQRRRYLWAIHRRLGETWYAPLADWCRTHGLWLMGHPAGGDEIGVQRHFHVPGQDLVWRKVVPDDPSALEGPESTQGKCSSSAMIHFGRRRNSNEFCGAYGHELTFDEMRWLADWCFIRGVNLLIPHAFYYSVRGPRRDERPPDVGPNSPWWDRFGPFADHCRRLSWLNTDSRHVCDVAVLAEPDRCPWAAAKALFEAQRDFNYLDVRQFAGEADLDKGVSIADMHYRAVVVEPGLAAPDEAMRRLDLLQARGRLVRWTGDAGALVERIDRLAPPDLVADRPQPALRHRHVVKEGRHFHLLFNEGREPIAFGLTRPAGPLWRVDTWHGAETSPAELDAIRLAGYETLLLAGPGSGGEPGVGRRHLIPPGRRAEDRS